MPGQQLHRHQQPKVPRHDDNVGGLIALTTYLVSHFETPHLYVGGLGTLTDFCADAILHDHLTHNNEAAHSRRRVLAAHQQNNRSMFYRIIHKVRQQIRSDI